MAPDHEDARSSRFYQEFTMLLDDGWENIEVRDFEKGIYTALYWWNQWTAEYRYVRPGCTHIRLWDGESLRWQGDIIQLEKAEGICLHWVTEGEISSDFMWDCRRWAMQQVA